MSNPVGAKTISLEDGHRAIRLCDSYSRLPAIIRLATRMEERDWLSLLGAQWSCCDNVSQFIEPLRRETPFGKLISNPLHWRSALMTKAERDELDALPDKVTIYRGCYDHNKYGLSWTLSRPVAEKFPLLVRYRAEGEMLLVRAVIERDAILALKQDRNEHEVIAWKPKIEAVGHIGWP